MRELGNLKKIILSTEKSFKRYIIIPNILKKKNHLLKMCAVFFAIQYLSSNPFRNRSSVRKPIKPNVFADNSGHFFLLFFTYA